MCGIIGIISNSKNQKIYQDNIISMRDSMIHRGPDDAGLFLYEEEDFFIGLGHRRLSIIDLSPFGRQPMTTSDGNLVIIFNGEIFNFYELKNELNIKGKYSFSSKTDTEVILYAIREWGLEGCLKRLRGMYAFAIFDKRKLSVTLVRDPLGVKPIYYTMGNNYFIFASEIKAILKLPTIKPILNEQGLYHYLTFANVPVPETLFKGIYKLESGCYLEVSRDCNLKKVKYWDSANFEPFPYHIDENDAIYEIRRLIRQSIKRRMVSDVPFGVFLSGGVDSSLNVALMSQLMNDPVETFSVGLKDDHPNEFHYARQIANLFNTNHHELIISDEDFISFLPKMAFYQDEPLADPVCIPLYYISKLARDLRTIVIQVGEGSDEIFSGYDTHRIFNKIDKNTYYYYKKLPQKIKLHIYNTVYKLFNPIISDAFRRGYNCEPLFVGNAIAFWDIEKQVLLKNIRNMTSSSQFIKELIDNFLCKESLWKIINIELKNRLPELLLMRVDKMSMANSIETRVPFLDEDLVEFVLRIPSDLKEKNGQNKYILKKSAEGIIPNEIIYRKKMGFCGSATNMISSKIMEYAEKKITNNYLITDLFNKNYISRIFTNYKSQKRFNSFKIFNLLNLVLWHEQWIEGKDE